MSSRSYLCGVAAPDVLPRFDEGYDTATQTLASDVDYLPLLWLALFREGDLRRTTVTIEGEALDVVAPVCATERALRQLDAAMPALCTHLPRADLRAYTYLLASGIRSAGFPYVTPELEEISALYPTEHRFDELLTLALRGFDDPHGLQFECPDVVWDVPTADGLTFDAPPGDLMAQLDNLAPGESLVIGFGGSETEPVTIPGFSLSSHWQILVHLAGLRLDAPLPPARMYLSDRPATDDERWNFTRVLGAGRFGSLGIGREVPWEKEDADFGWEIR